MRKIVFLFLSSFNDVLSGIFLLLLPFLVSRALCVCVQFALNVNVVFRAIILCIAATTNEL